MTEHVLTWHARLSGRTDATPPDGQPSLLGMPAGLVRPRRQIQAADSLTPAASAVLAEVLASLRRFGPAPAASERIALQSLSADDRAVVLDLLGEGDVTADVGGGAHWRVQETVLTGLWRVEAHEADDRRTEWLEVATVPQAVVQAADRFSRERVDIPGQWPRGAMNAPALIAELHERARTWDAERFRRAAHSLKSNGNTFGALALAGQAREPSRLRAAADAAADEAAIAGIDAAFADAAAELKSLSHG